MRGLLGRWLPSLAWMAFISYWSHQQALPIDGDPDSREALHVLAHLSGFALLAGFNRWALNGVSRATLWAVALAAAFGFVDEWHQSLIPGREATLVDVATDGVGATLIAWRGTIARLLQRSIGGPGAARAG